MQQSAFMRRNALIDLNVLPADLRPRQYPAWYVMGLGALLIALALLVPVVLAKHAASQETASLRSQLTLITGQLEGVGMDLGQVRGLRYELDQSETELAALQNERKTFLGIGRPLSEGLSLLYAVAPPGVQVDTITRVDGAVIIQGQAPNAESVIAYSRALAQGDRFSDATIIALTAVDGAAPTTFSVQAIW